ncbi:hypothetical protein BU23DRAFT_631204 [Bimuria novae-zelandiae CBS 107.79]|uniref:Uncharacterized protein n=1 Tax=Bimuria novae-zelandiae CBS 107.79 TaxID=1447943 RepID=A0A6A5VFM2_9PLEO|nr:hypothetical protein BU23DRAFT_631204 [Bimuria novae-zelandiae CBS 107.79]
MPHPQRESTGSSGPKYNTSRTSEEERAWKHIRTSVQAFESRELNEAEGIEVDFGGITEPLIRIDVAWNKTIHVGIKKSQLRYTPCIILHNLLYTDAREPYEEKQVRRDDIRALCGLGNVLNDSASWFSELRLMLLRICHTTRAEDISEFTTDLCIVKNGMIAGLDWVKGSISDQICTMARAPRVPYQRCKRNSPKDRTSLDWRSNPSCTTVISGLVDIEAHMKKHIPRTNNRGLAYHGGYENFDRYQYSAYADGRGRTASSEDVEYRSHHARRDKTRAYYGARGPQSYDGSFERVCINIARSFVYVNSEIQSWVHAIRSLSEATVTLVTFVIYIAYHCTLECIKCAPTASRRLVERVMKILDVGESGAPVAIATCESMFIIEKAFLLQP